MVRALEAHVVLQLQLQVDWRRHANIIEGIQATQMIRKGQVLAEQSAEDSAIACTVPVTYA
jgi:hypothetical protein